jgi:hypothetical protein
MKRAALTLSFASLTSSLAACPGTTSTLHGPDATSTDAVHALAGARLSVTSFRADSTMDFLFNDQRLKTEVIVIGQPGAHVRVNVLDPANAVLADLACDGTTFYYRDSQHNCELTGPCNADTIEQLFHIDLKPDDFLYLAAGTPPVMDGSATMSWDSKAGREHVTITGAAGTETIDIDGTNGHRDPVRAEMKDATGQHVWTVENKDFTDVAGHRVPGATRFMPENKSNDLIVDWKQLELNVQLPADKFKFALIGLPQCGQKPSAAPAGSAAPPHP